MFADNFLYLAELVANIAFNTWQYQEPNSNPALES